MRRGVTTAGPFAPAGASKRQSTRHSEALGALSTASGAPMTVQSLDREYLAAMFPGDLRCTVTARRGSLAVTVQLAVDAGASEPVQLPGSGADRSGRAGQVRVTPLPTMRTSWGNGPVLLGRTTAPMAPGTPAVSTVRLTKGAIEEVGIHVRAIGPRHGANGCLRLGPDRESPQPYHQGGSPWCRALLTIEPRCDHRAFAAPSRWGGANAWVMR
jgi:hypothetical protein